MEKFPWRSFFIQAPQALYSITGYGLVLGGIMGFTVDAFWGVIRSPFNGFPTIIGPPPSDPVGKAARYVAQPAIHMLGGAALSYEDHWLLAAADAVAIQILAGAASASVLDDRLGVIAESPLIRFEPWHPATVAALAALGVDRSSAKAHAVPGLPELATYGDVLSLVGQQYPQFLQEARVDFPPTLSATSLAMMVADSGDSILRWGAGGEAAVSPTFEIDELIFARMFEYGVFPPDDFELVSMDRFFERSYAIARASGHNLPNRAEMILAAVEVWGGHSLA